MRHPDEILKDFDDGARGVRDVDMREVLHEIIADICDSYKLALSKAGVPTTIQTEVNLTVQDYIMNHYGDD